MKIFFLIIASLFILSCKNDEIKEVEKKVFIVSKFNSDIEKNIQEAILQDPERASLIEIKEYDYPKGAINFIIMKDSTVYFYNEKLIWDWCGWNSNKVELKKRILQKDSLHKISFNQIYPLLQFKSLEKKMRDGWNNLYPISFSFENDTIKNFDVYKLFQEIDSLGFHSYDVRRIAPFEQKALKDINK